MIKSDLESSRIGIDLGASKISGIIIDKNGKEILRKRRKVSPSYESLLKSIIEIIEQLEMAGGMIGSIGICIPGFINSLGQPVNAVNLPCINNSSLILDLEKYFGRSIECENDANCFLLSEIIDGAAVDRSLVFGIILGTGVGGALASNGKLILGKNGMLGEWGHNPLPWRELHDGDEKYCGCGRYGCIETYLNGLALTHDYKSITRKELDAEAIGCAAEAGDINAIEAIDRYSKRLAKALASVINLFDPDIIVLGGGLSQIDFIYDRVPKVWTSYTVTKLITTDLRKAIHGPDSGMRGAAYL